MHDPTESAQEGCVRKTWNVCTETTMDAGVKMLNSVDHITSENMKNERRARFTKAVELDGKLDDFLKRLRLTSGIDTEDQILKIFCSEDKKHDVEKALQIELQDITENLHPFVEVVTTTTTAFGLERNKGKIAERKLEERLLSILVGNGSAQQSKDYVQEPSHEPRRLRDRLAVLMLLFAIVVLMIVVEVWLLTMIFPLLVPMLNHIVGARQSAMLIPIEDEGSLGNPSRDLALIELLREERDVPGLMRKLDLRIRKNRLMKAMRWLSEEKMVMGHKYDNLRALALCYDHKSLRNFYPSPITFTRQRCQNIEDSFQSQKRLLDRIEIRFEDLQFIINTSIPSFTNYLILPSKVTESFQEVISTNQMKRYGQGVVWKIIFSGCYHYSIDTVLPEGWMHPDMERWLVKEVNTCNVMASVLNVNLDASAPDEVFNKSLQATSSGTLSLVGRSGSGKTSIMAELMRQKLAQVFSEMLTAAATHVRSCFMLVLEALDQGKDAHKAQATMGLQPSPTVENWNIEKRLQIGELVLRK